MGGGGPGPSKFPLGLGPDRRKLLCRLCCPEGVEGCCSSNVSMMDSKPTWPTNRRKARARASMSHGERGLLRRESDQVAKSGGQNRLQLRSLSHHRHQTTREPVRPLASPERRARSGLSQDLPQRPGRQQTSTLSFDVVEPRKAAKHTRCTRAAFHKRLQFYGEVRPVAGAARVFPDGCKKSVAGAANAAPHAVLLLLP